MVAEPSSILFFIPNLNGGGAERAVLNILRNWHLSKHRAIRPVLVMRTFDGQLKEEVPAGMMTVDLGVSRAGNWASLATVVKLSRVLKEIRPKVLISLLSLPSVVLAKRMSGVSAALVASIQNPVALPGGKPGALLKWSLHSSDWCWPIAPGIGNQLHAECGVPKERVEVLPNSVDLDRVKALSREPVDHPFFTSEAIPLVVTVCRLAEQKRVDILLRAIASLSKRRPVKLAIIGEGHLRDELETLTKELGMSERVCFLGFQSNPWRFISRAAVLALASDYEGFGNVIIEAMACCTPVVSSSAPFGPAFIIDHESNGILTPCGDVEALSVSIERVLQDSALRAKCIDGGTTRSAAFSIYEVMKQFDSLLEKALKTEN